MRSVNLCQPSFPLPGLSKEEEHIGVDSEAKWIREIVDRHHRTIGKLSQQRTRATRRQLSDVVRKYMSETINSFNRQSLEWLSDPDTVILELGNSPKIFHLGMMRMLVKTLHWADQIYKQTGRRSVVLYIHTDLVTPSVVSEARWLRYYVRGKLPRRPFHYGTPSKHQDLPSKYILAPSQGDLEGLKGRLSGQVRQNIAYAQELGWRTEVTVEELQHRIEKCMNDLISSAQAVKDFASWTVHYHWRVLTQMMDQVPNLLIFPTSKTFGTFPELIEDYIKRQEEINQLRGMPSPAVDAWIYCPHSNCRLRSTGPLLINKNRLEVTANCGRCHRELRGSIKEFDSAPNVFMRQSLFAGLGLALRVVGNIRPYAHWADQIARDILGFEIPLRYRLSGQPCFMGIGEPEGGCGRTSILRALFEIDPLRLYRTLVNSSPSAELYVPSEFLNFKN